MALVTTVKQARSDVRDLVTPRTALLGALGAATAAVVFLHYWQLSGIPGGAFSDEVAVSWNAIGIATDGRDAHGNAWPVFFQPFGYGEDWKNPIMVYGVALAFRLFGSSMAIQRAVPSTFSLAAAALIGILAWQLSRNRWLGLGAFLTAAVTPWLFTVGRNGYETVTLPMTLAAFLVVWHLASRRHDWRWAAGAGLLLGFSLYAYSTARLYVPLLCLALVLAELPGFRWKLILAAGGGAALAAIPMALFMHAHPGALTHRLGVISIFTNQPSLLATLGSMWRVYTSGFAPNFLFGFDYYQIGGVLFLLLMPVLVIGLVGFWHNRRDPFYRLAFIGLLMAPIPAAFTPAFSHQLRNIEAVPFYAVLAIAGVRELLPVLRGHRAIAVAMVALLTFQAGWFLSDYFTNGPGYFASLQEAAMPQVATYLARHNYHGVVDVSYSVPSGSSLLAYWQGESVQAVRSKGTGNVQMYNDQGVVAAPGTAIVTAAGDTPAGAYHLETFYSRQQDGWGGTQYLPQLELWVVPYPST